MSIGPSESLNQGQTVPATPKHSPRSSVIEVSDWKPVAKNTLCVSLSNSLPSGLLIRDCTLHDRDGARWVGLPTRHYATKAGVDGRICFVDFASPEIGDRFHDEILGALDESGVA